MIVDNLIVNSFTKELTKYLINSKIERIGQISKDSFLFNFWNKKNFKVIVSLNSENYRICFTKKNYKINNQGSTFFMHLKKSIEGGVLLDIEQINFDRIIKFKIESLDNVKDKVIYNLIIELTGKYSNLILTDENEIVLGAYKTIDDTQNEERQIILGSKYAPITNKLNKIDLSILDYETFNNLFKENKQSLRNFLVKSFLGISNNTASLLIEKSNIIDIDKDKNKLFENIKNFSKQLEENTLNLKFNNLNQITSLSEVSFTFSNTILEDFTLYLDNLYQEKEEISQYISFQTNLKKIVEKSLSKIRDKKNSLEETISKSENFEIYKQWGDLIYSNLYKLPENASKIELENYYNNNEIVSIELDNNKTVSDNAQTFFKKYNKLKTGLEKTKEILIDVNSEISYLEEVLLFIENSESIEDLNEIEEELINGKYLNKNSKQINKKNKMDKTHLLSYQTESGLEILIGKNNMQNEFLTTKFASNHDLWLHTRLIAGSHVVIRTENGQKKVNDKDIIEAAKLAVRYSKAKYSSNVCVIYTKIKNIKKPPKSKLGLVIYSNEKAVYVTP
ncbi:MAG: NFACT RNA binding domain-containing protein [Candidatus Sericytochromatia bacterium]